MTDPIPTGWRPLGRGVDEAETLAFLADSAARELAESGIPPELVEVLAGQQALARLRGHSGAYSSTRVRLATCDGRRLGGRLFAADLDSETVLVDLVVHPDFRRTGGARWLLEQELAAAARQQRAISLSVVPGSPAERLYRSAGFVDASSASPTDVFRISLRLGQ